MGEKKIIVLKYNQRYGSTFLTRKSILSTEYLHLDYILLLFYIKASNLKLITNFLKEKNIFKNTILPAKLFGKIF